MQDRDLPPINYPAVKVCPAEKKKKKKKMAQGIPRPSSWSIMSTLLSPSLTYDLTPFQLKFR
jgi:hypothetical protein